MLPGIAGIQAGIGGGVDAYSVTYLSRVTAGSLIGSSNTFEDYSIGDAATSRRIFVIVHWFEGGTHRTLSSVTIGGVSATVHIQEGHTGGLSGFGVGIASAAVPTGTTVDIEVVMSGGLSAINISCIRATGLSQSSPHDTAVDETHDTAGDLSDTINIPANGLCIAGFTSSDNADEKTVSWTGVTEEYDVNADGRESMAWSSAMSEQTGRTISADVSSNTVNAGNAMVAVSWA